MRVLATLRYGDGRRLRRRFLRLAIPSFWARLSIRYSSRASKSWHASCAYWMKNRWSSQYDRSLFSLTVQAVAAGEPVVLVLVEDARKLVEQLVHVRITLDDRDRRYA